MSTETEIDDLNQLIKLARTRITELKRCERIHARSGDYRDMTPKRAERIEADLQWQAMALIRNEAELHAAAVNCGIADLREESHYGEIDLRPSGFHHYKFQRPKPRALTSQTI